MSNHRDNYDHDGIEEVLAGTGRTTRNEMRMTARANRKQETPSMVGIIAKDYFLSHVCDSEPEQLLDAGVRNGRENEEEIGARFYESRQFAPCSPKERKPTSIEWKTNTLSHSSRNTEETAEG